MGGLKEAAILAESLRQLIEVHSFKHGNQTINITITCGVIQVEKNETLEQALGRVDRALYQGKENGRNQVSIGESSQYSLGLKQ